MWYCLVRLKSEFIIYILLRKKVQNENRAQD